MGPMGTIWGTMGSMGPIWEDHGPHGNHLEGTVGPMASGSYGVLKDGEKYKDRLSRSWREKIETMLQMKLNKQSFGQMLATFALWALKARFVR